MVEGWEEERENDMDGKVKVKGGEGKMRTVPVRSSFCTRLCSGQKLWGL